MRARELEQRPGVAWSDTRTVRAVRGSRSSDEFRKRLVIRTEDWPSRKHGHAVFATGVVHRLAERGMHGRQPLELLQLVYATRPLGVLVDFLQGHEVRLHAA